MEHTNNNSFSFLKLNNGASIPSIGFGSGSYPVPPTPTLTAAFASALQVGYRHFDTASIYGSEPALGQVLSEAFASGSVRRQDVFVTSKLWSNSHEPEDVARALQESLSALQLQYLDLYLIHWPVKIKKESHFPKEEDFLPLDIKSTWQALENCVERGLTKAIGVSNFSVKKLQDLLTYAKIPPAVNQVELNPSWQQKKLRDFCNSVGIVVTAYSPLGSQSGLTATPIRNHPVIEDIAKKHGKTPAQVILRWVLESGVSFLPRSFNPSRIAENFNIWDFKLSKEDHEVIGQIEQKKIFKGDEFCNQTTSPYKTPADLWDGEI